MLVTKFVTRHTKKKKQIKISCMKKACNIEKCFKVKRLKQSKTLQMKKSLYKYFPQNIKEVNTRFCETEGNILEVTLGVMRHEHGTKEMDARPPTHTHDTLERQHTRTPDLHSPSFCVRTHLPTAYTIFWSLISKELLSFQLKKNTVTCCK